MKILIVEDDPVSQKLLGKIVRREGYDTVLVNDGKSAWEKVKKEKCNMVLTDWMMPGMNGLQLCKKIRQANFQKFLKLLT